MSDVIWAGFDIGTNSVKVLVAAVDVTARRLSRVLYHDVAITRMGQDLGRTGVVSEEGLQRTIQAVRLLHDKARGFAPAGWCSAGMEAFRRASNASVLIERLRRECGVDVRVLRGEEEASLGRAGVVSAFGTTEPLLMVDIGGGSTELALTTPSFEVSVPRGAVVTTERYLVDDPPTAQQMSVMRDELQVAFAEVWRAAPQGVIARLIGVGGTLTTYAAVAQSLEPYDSSKVHGYGMSMDEIRAITDRLAALPLARRREVRGLQPARAPVIVGGGAILEAVMSVVGAGAVTVSEANLLHALVVEAAAGASTPSS
jgi:exopolyphosphatase/guanosine-5'-triphosphate,3'-diphosphate pyrophosphatase